MQIYQKDTPTNCEISESFKNNFFYMTPPVAASGSASF